MTWLYYANHQGNGDWPFAIRAAEAQLRPYDLYLRRAIEYARQNACSLQWRFPTKEIAAELSKHHRAKNGAVWVLLEPRTDRHDDFDAALDAFMSRQTQEVYVDPRCRRDQQIAILARSREASALLLKTKPAPWLENDEDGAREHQALFLRVDTWPLRAQQQAVRDLRDRPEPHQSPLIRLLVAHRHASWPAVEPASEDTVTWQLLTDADRSGTQRQRDFVRTALGTPDFALLEGPPGSGKTTTICELILQAARRGQRVLLVASTHVAVDNVLEALMAHESGSEEKTILPVRIGDEERVDSELSSSFLAHRLEATLRQEIRRHLDAGGPEDLDGARRRLREALRNPKDDSNTVLQLLLESANLICGTTIGFLGFTRRQEARSLSSEPFDFMILDEASKTSFSEFLVPARFARRWVIVGDRRQLSPYVDDEQLEGNLDALLDESDRQICEDVFLAGSARLDEGRAVVVAAAPPVLARYHAQARATGVPWANLDALKRLDSVRNRLFLGSPAGALRAEHLLSEDTRRIRSPVPLTLLERRRAWSEHVAPAGKVSWGGLMAWRIVRAYELRDDPTLRRRLDLARERLQPVWLSEDQKRVLHLRVDDVRRVALPSVLELLQRGFEKQPGQRADVPLTDGLGPALAGRMVSLQHQHRMHPEIARFPREAFYSDTHEQLLQDADGMAIRRGFPWSYDRFEHRAEWIHVPGRDRNNVNHAESDACLDELRQFLAWASHVPAPEPGKPWTVAILTFYRAQEAHLRQQLRRLDRERGGTGLAFDRFQVLDQGRKPSVEITLRTVDRFQGQQADLVLLSFVRTGGPGFLTSRHRMNVALTRARYQLVLVGHRRNFARPDMPTFLQRLAEDIPARIQWRPHGAH